MSQAKIFDSVTADDMKPQWFTRIMYVEILQICYFVIETCFEQNNSTFVIKIATFMAVTNGGYRVFVRRSHVLLCFQTHT